MSCTLIAERFPLLDLALSSLERVDGQAPLARGAQPRAGGSRPLPHTTFAMVQGVCLNPASVPVRMRYNRAVERMFLKLRLPSGVVVQHWLDPNEPGAHDALTQLWLRCTDRRAYERSQY